MEIVEGVSRLLNWIIYILLGIFLLLFLIIITKLNIKIDMFHEQDNDHIKITVKAWYFITFTYNVPLVKVDEESPSIVVEQEMGQGEKVEAEDKTKKIKPKDIICKMKQMQYLIEKVVGLHKIIKRFLSHIQVHKVEWKTSIGLGDAAHTGLISGVIWMIKGNVTGLISHYMNLKARPELEVTPYFQNNLSRTHFICMFSFRIGQAILAGLRMLKYWKGKTKRRKPACQNIQSKA